MPKTLRNVQNENVPPEDVTDPKAKEVLSKIMPEQPTWIEAGKRAVLHIPPLKIISKLTITLHDHMINFLSLIHRAMTSSKRKSSPGVQIIGVTPITWADGRQVSGENFGGGAAYRGVGKSSHEGDNADK